MIQVIFTVKEHDICGFEISGHSDYAEEGYALGHRQKDQRDECRGALKQKLSKWRKAEGIVKDARGAKDSAARQKRRDKAALAKGDIEPLVKREKRHRDKGREKKGESSKARSVVKMYLSYTVGTVERARRVG